MLSAWNVNISCSRPAAEVEVGLVERDRTQHVCGVDDGALRAASAAADDQHRGEGCDDPGLRGDLRSAWQTWLQGPAAPDGLTAHRSQPGEQQNAALHHRVSILRFECSSDVHKIIPSIHTWFCVPERCAGESAIAAQKAGKTGLALAPLTAAFTAATPKPTFRIVSLIKC